VGKDFADAVCEIDQSDLDRTPSALPLARQPAQLLRHRLPPLALRPRRAALAPLRLPRELERELAVALDARGVDAPVGDRLPDGAPGLGPVRAVPEGGGIRTGASPAVRRADAATRASGHDPRVRNRPEAGARASGACGAPRPRPGPRRPARRRTRCRHREDPGRRPVDLPPANATPQCCASLGDPKGSPARHAAGRV
jgi:hypothetical protein